MGKAWDGSGIAYSVEMWAEVLRVLKPGGHLCAFGGTRTYHRMACAIEDAGFEIRDSLHWVYGSGFPKSLNVGKAIDKQRDDRADIETVVRWMEATRQASGVSRQQVEDAFGTVNIGQAFFTITPGSSPRVPTLEQVPVLLQLFGLTLDDAPEEIRRLLWDLNGRKGQPGDNWWKREVVGTRTDVATRIYDMGEGPRLPSEINITTAATDAAKQWEGWGTALKPAHEPIVLARRPLIGTVAANVLTHGTGALNIDGARVDGGRWPANVIFDTETGALLDRQEYGASRFFTSIKWDKYTDTGIDAPFRYIAKPSKQERNAGLDGLPKQQGGSYEGRADGSLGQKTAKAANVHPTVKPLALMRWLVKLVTPPGGTVLEPFAGSGTTLMACVLEGFNGIGIEMTDEYLSIIEGRVRWAQHQPPRLFL
jgi:DNA modification methylase